MEIRKLASISLEQRIRLLRWGAPILVLVLAAMHQSVLHLLLDHFSPAWHDIVQLAVYGATGIVAAWIGLTWIAHAVARRDQTEADLRRAYSDLERTHRQLRTIHQVGHRITNAADVHELLDIAARVPVDLLDAPGTTVITFDEEENDPTLEITWGLDDTAVRALRRRVRTDFPSNRCRSCRPLTAQVMDDCPLLKPLVEAECAGGIDRVVCLPLGRGQKRMGIVAAYLNDAALPSAKQLNLVNILAAEITAALEGVRLRADKMATLYAVDRATQEHDDLDALLQRVLTTTAVGWGAQAGAILLAEGPEAWSVRVHWGMGEGVGSDEMGLVLRLAEEARTSDRPVIVPEREGQRLASVATVPLPAEGGTLGVLFLGAEEPHTFTLNQIDLFTTIAHQIALAVRNAQLYSRLRQMAVLEERYRLAREMHDGLAQTLGYLGMQVERLERLLVEGRHRVLRAELAEVRESIDEAYMDVREAIEGLRLGGEHAGGLPDALRTHLEDFARRTGVQVDDGGIDVARAGTLPPEVALQLLRIAQEALTNVRRHARAQHVRVELYRVDGTLELTIADDGCGFDPTLPQGRHHVGLASMRERARSIGGRLTLATGPGQGTRVTVRVPVR